MKCKRPGKKPVHFGQCKTVEATKRYALIEGFHIAKASCCACKFDWEMIVHPDKLPFKIHKGVQAFSMPDQPCVNCNVKRVILTIKGK